MELTNELMTILDSINDMRLYSSNFKSYVKEFLGTNPFPTLNDILKFIASKLKIDKQKNHIQKMKKTR